MGRADLLMRHRAAAAASRSAEGAAAGRRVVLRAADGAAVAGWWVDAVGPARGVVVLVPATGVSQRFYRRFASWLAQQGHAVLGLDFRGIGESRPHSLRGFDATLDHWVLDLDAALARALDEAGSGVPVAALGHSIGGTLLFMAEQAPRLRTLVAVGAQTAHWHDFPHPQRWPMALLWHGVMPALAGTFGYFPARALGLGEDLPRGVAMQWALRPWRPLFADADAAARRQRTLPAVHLLAARDDVFATPAAVDRLLAMLPGLAVQRHVIEPAAHGLARIGHFDLFRERCAAAWPLLLSRFDPHHPSLTTRTAP